jgi:hypothetical protein
MQSPPSTSILTHHVFVVEHGPAAQISFIIVFTVFQCACFIQQVVDLAAVDIHSVQ